MPSARFHPSFPVALLPLAIALFGAEAKAECIPDFGSAHIQQSNGPLLVLKLDQAETQANGSAFWYDDGGDRVINRAEVSGTVGPNLIQLRFEWANPAQHRVAWYTASVSDNGTIAGITYPEHSPQERASWSLTSSRRCLADAVSLQVSRSSNDGVKLEFGVMPENISPGYFRVLRDGKEERKIAIDTDRDPRSRIYYARNAGASNFRICFRTHNGHETCSATRNVPLSGTEITAASSNAKLGGLVRPPVTQSSKLADQSVSSFRCKPGYVWRVARPEDRVCVTPDSRELAAAENQAKKYRRDPAGAYGPESCRAGFVWREAFIGDTTCVSPNRRAQVEEENRLARLRVEQ